MGARSAITPSFCFACLSVFCSIPVVWSFTFARLACLSHTSFCTLSNLSTPKYFSWSANQLDTSHGHCPSHLWSDYIPPHVNLLAKIEASITNYMHRLCLSFNAQLSTATLFTRGIRLAPPTHYLRI